MRLRAAAIIAGVLLGGTAPVVAQQPATTVQQDFEAAMGLAAKGDNAAALSAWQALEKRIPTKNGRNLALVRVRLGASLYSLNRLDEAVVAVRAGLADLPVSDASLNPYRHDAYFQLGQIAEAGLDYASAAESYRAADPLAPDVVARLATLRGLVATGTFVDPARAASDLARAEGVLASVATDAKSKAVFAMLKSVLLLNSGKFPEARGAAADAVKLLGGLTLKTDLYDVAARSDYAIAALLSGRYDDAREYMAATGAGRLPKGKFDPGVQMKAPYCGGDEGLQPNDAAVIEFSIGDDGAVSLVTPIYAAGGGQAALAFAKAARGWSWTPEQVKQLPLFFRYRARVEMRCSTEFERPSLNDFLGAEIDAWLTQKGISLVPIQTGSDAAVLPGQRAKLAELEATKGKASLELVPVLYALMSNAVVGREETNMLAKRALAIVDAQGMNASARLGIQRFVWSTDRLDPWARSALSETLEPALQDPHYRDDPRARAAIRLMLADGVRGRDADMAGRLLTEISNDTALASNDPLRVGALMRTASMKAAEGNMAAAKTAFDNSGLSARQCAIMDSAPRMVRNNAGSDSFPQEALRWGFEGWTQIQYDIGADGKVLNERAIMSYPPFVFTTAGNRVAKAFQYEKSYRPDGGLGCGGNSTRVRFIL